MAHYGLLRDYKFDNTTARDDIRGTKIYGRKSMAAMTRSSAP